MESLFLCFKTSYFTVWILGFAFGLLKARESHQLVGFILLLHTKVKVSSLFWYKWSCAQLLGGTVAEALSTVSYSPVSMHRWCSPSILLSTCCCCSAQSSCSCKWTPRVHSSFCFHSSNWLLVLLTSRKPSCFLSPGPLPDALLKDFFCPFCSLFLAFNFGGVLKVLRIFIWILLLTWVSCCDPGQHWTPSKLEMTLSLWELGLQVWPPCPASQLTQSQRIAIFIWHAQSIFRSRTWGGQASRRIHSWALTISLFLLLLLC